MNKPLTLSRPHATCLRTRLAETAFAAVDYCQCGHMHVHLGPFSVRLTPEALAGLNDAIDLALTAHHTTTRSAPPNARLAS